MTVAKQAVETAIRRASEADDHETLWTALEPVRPALGSELALASIWSEALRATPERPSLVEEAEVIVAAFPGEPRVIGSTVAALLRVAQRRPVDEPPLSEGAASVAASAADRCRARLAVAERDDPDVGGALLVSYGNALALMGPARYDDAVSAIERALKLSRRSAWLGDLALAHLRARNFPQMHLALGEAIAVGSLSRPMWFNVALAATAVGDGEGAATAWRELGIPAPTPDPGRLPIVEGLDPVQVRLPTLGSGFGPPGELPDEAAGFELVWVQPLSPCHGVVRSPTFREARADFGDVILWHGAPIGVREIEGKTVPRFPFLGRLLEGDEHRYRFIALQQREGQVDALGEALGEGPVLYQHGERVERMCPRCAAGELMRKHEHAPAEPHRIVYGKLVGPASLSASALAERLREARGLHPGVRLAIPSLYEAIGDTRQAGTHHKRWGTIERAAQAATGGVGGKRT